jgi:hypothetical protein
MSTRTCCLIVFLWVVILGTSGCATTVMPGTTLTDAQVEFVEQDHKIDVMVGGKLFTSYVWQVDPDKPMVAKGRKLAKPILFPVYTPSGTMVTRGYPFIDVEGESQDHPHHMGVYFTVDINREFFWGNSNKDLPAIKHIKVSKMKGRKGRGTLSTISHWVGSDGNVMLEEQREMIFYAAAPNAYAIDFNICLKAVDQEVVFGDTKEGMMAIRVAPWLKETKGGNGTYLSSNGAEKEKNVWGRRAEWMRLQGKKDDKTYGVAILNHPSSTNYPTFWHARGYGCFTANPLGQGAFERSLKVPDAQNLDLMLKPGEEAWFKHRMIILEGPSSHLQLDMAFAEYAD